MKTLSPWKPWPFKLEFQKNTCLALIIQIIQLKQFFLKKEQSYVNSSYLFQQHTKSYFKIDLNLTIIFNVYFLYQKS